MKVIGSLLILCLCSWVSAERAAAQEKFRVASGGFPTAIHPLLWVAYEKQIFQKYGLDGEYLALESGTSAVQALLDQELQIVFTNGALAITANLQGGDTTIVAGGINFIPSKLVVRPDIKTPEALKGKRIALSRFGSASDYATQVALEKLAVNPEDLTIVEVGGNLSRLVALGTGKKKTRPLGSDEDTMQPEYDFLKAVRGVTAARYAEGANVVLDPDVAKIVSNTRAVNEALRTIARVTRTTLRQCARKCTA